MWTIQNWLERNKIFTHCGKVLSKEVDLGEATSFLDHICLGGTQRECQTSKDIVENCLSLLTDFSEMSILGSY